MAGDLLEQSLRSFTIYGEDVPHDTSQLPAPRRSSADVVRTVAGNGRSRFHVGICKDHPFWPMDSDEKGNNIPFTDSAYATPDFPCAKFSELPGKGRGIKQPSATRILIGGFFELARPLAMVALLFFALWGLNHVVRGGGIHFLQSGSHVQPSTCRVSVSSEHGKTDSLRNTSRRPSPRASSVPACIRSDSAVKK